ncbi:hypothetical protein E2C01_091724 [Portunus trituberculatus]|uniref:Uncharacterized protein n=1 Tax=Portunus trituberculatus TaxID=210409 RepID=A0A5B7JPV1_PORTR|nr:hypothetical protein [Portunus trituberculatus]
MLCDSPARPPAGRKLSLSCNRASARLLWRYAAQGTSGRRVNALTFCKTSPVSASHRRSFVSHPATAQTS